MKTQNNKDQSAGVKKEIEQALTSNAISFEEMPEEGGSPLNQPVVEKDVHNTRPPSAASNTDIPESKDEVEVTEESDISSDIPLDAPEQEIDNTRTGQLHSEEDNEIPLSHAQIAADTFLGMTDNLMEVGGGFFVKIRKHEEFYEFEEVVQVIEEQNDKNIRRLKLDEEDKALLRPLLIIIIRRRAKKLTPEQQLAGAVISIFIKKIKTAIEVRAENNMLVDRIREIIRQETEKKKDNTSSADMHSQNPNPHPEMAAVVEVAD